MRLPAPPRAVTITLVCALLLALSAVLVRGLPARALVDPRDEIESGPRIVEPMQFLGAGARLRAAELDTWIDAARRPRFTALRDQLFHIDDCPPLLSWIDSVEGQRLERLLGELRSGTREEGLAALTLLFQLARACEWDPAIFATTRHANAERLGGLFEEWLRAWSERAAADPLLSEPCQAAVLVYGRAMRTAQRAPLVGSNAAPYTRALTSLRGWLGLERGRRTRLGEVLQARHPAALERLQQPEDALRGLDEAASVMFPDLDGECGS